MNSMLRFNIKILVATIAMTLLSSAVLAPSASAVGPGVTASTVLQLSGATDGHLSKIVSSDDGQSAIAMWTTGGQNPLRARYWNGTGWQAAQTVFDAGGAMYEFTTAAAPNGKSFAIAYRSTSGYTYVHTATVVADDVVWATRVAPFGQSSYSYRPHLVYSGDSSKLMVVSEQAQGANYWLDIVSKSATIGASGEVTWDTSAIAIPNTDPNSEANTTFFPKVSLSHDGSSGVVVFGREIPASFNGYEKIQASYYSCSGSPESCTWSENVDLTTDTSLFRHPEVKISADGQTAIAAWESGGIYAKTASLVAGTMTWSATTTTIASDGNAGGLELAATSAGTKVTLAWTSSGAVRSATTLDNGSTWTTTK
ncbi:MAG: hypothetical protein RIS09_1099, partial [Actinomycetota bacterium]